MRQNEKGLRAEFTKADYLPFILKSAKKQLYNTRDGRVESEDAEDY
jgi:hypothetical protein